MTTCDDYRELIWDDLFGLLESAERKQLHAHLEDCAACRIELGAARADHDLVVQAARLDIDVPPFTAPAEEPPPVVTARGVQPGRRLVVPRWSWAAAAAVLLLCGLSYGWYRVGLARSKSAYLVASDRAQKTARQRQEERQQAELAARALPVLERSRHLHMEVLGPAAHQPGAAGLYRVAVQNLDGKPADTRVRAQLVLGSRRVTLPSGAADRPGELLVRIPDNLAVSSRAPVHLDLEAEGGAATTKLKVPLGVQEPGLATALATDRSYYRLGEKLFFHSLTLERFTRNPPSRPVVLKYSLLDSHGAVVQSLAGQARADGAGAGSFTLPAAAPPGQYTLLLTETSNPYQPTTCHFLVAPGPQNGKATSPQTPSTKGATVDFFPESAELIAGVPNRVYVRVRDGQGGSPAAEIRVVDQQGQSQATARTYRAGEEDTGLGIVEFTPKAGQAYRLQVALPDKRSQELVLPPVVNEGLVLRVAKPVSPANKKLGLVLFRQGTAKAVVAGVSCRGWLVAQEKVQLQPGRNDVELRLEPASCGVLRIAVYEEENGTLEPSAQRLAYRYPGQRLQVSVRPHRHPVAGGEHVTLDLQAVNEKGQAEPVSYSVRAVGQEAGPAAEKSLVAQFDLLSELADPPSLADPGRLLEEGAEQATLLDLVLGSQRLPLRTRSANTGLARGEPSRRSMARDPWAASLVRLDNQPEVRRQYADAVVQKIDQLQASATARDGELALQGQRQLDEARALWLELQSYRESWSERWRVAFTLVILSLCALVAGLIGLPLFRRSRGWTIRRSYVAAALGSLSVCFLTVWVARSDLKGTGPGVEVSQLDALAVDLSRPLNTEPFQEIQRLASQELKVPARATHFDAPTMAPLGPYHSAPALPSLPDYAFTLSDSSPDAALPVTFCWKPLLPAADGKAQVEFDWPGKQAAVLVEVEVRSSSGRLGHAKLELAR